MGHLAAAIYRLVLAAWAGGHWAVGYLAVPILFASLDSRQTAGMVAGRMFQWEGALGMGAAVCLVACLFLMNGRQAWRQLDFGLVLAQALLTAVSLWGIQPWMARMKIDALPADVMESPLRDSFVAWHGVSSVLYLIQSLLALVLVWRLGKESRPLSGGPF